MFAGICGLEVLRKMVTAVETSSTKWSSLKELPVEVPMPKDLQFHSIFSCPVSRDKTSSNNPPMLLQCGHVICNACVKQMSNGQSL